MYKNRSEMLKEKLKESKGLVAQMESVYNNKLDKLQKEYDKCENEKQQFLLQIKEIQENNPNALGSVSLDQPFSSENQSVNNLTFFITEIFIIIIYTILYYYFSY